MRNAGNIRGCSFQVLDVLAPLQGLTVLDLGCGSGDIAAELSARGARVVGVDVNAELLREAESKQVPNAEFRHADLREFPDLTVAADGIWASFSAAYFPDLAAVLRSWSRNLKPGGWIVLTEIDDLFGHEPLSERSKTLLTGYAKDSLTAGRYDFLMGRKLKQHLEKAGFAVSRTMTLEDPELSFSGPARPDVLESWRARFESMKLLREFCGPDADRVRDEFLECLARTDHRSTAKVCCAIAAREPAQV